MKFVALILICLFLTSCSEAKNKDSDPSTSPPASLDCPTGFIAVLGSGALGTSNQRFLCDAI